MTQDKEQHSSSYDHPAASSHLHGCLQLTVHKRKTKSVTKKEGRGEEERDLLEDNAALVENNGLRASDDLCLKETKKNSIGG
jgi:hypothetical protein